AVSAACAGPARSEDWHVLRTLPSSQELGEASAQPDRSRKPAQARARRVHGGASRFGSHSGWLVPRPLPTVKRILGADAYVSSARRWHRLRLARRVAEPKDQDAKAGDS